nr:delta-lactam-biosynthetic de-N-acetylase [Pueribacillus theae]
MLPVQAFAKQYNNMQYDWYFKPSKDNKPATTEPEFAEMLNKHGGIFIAETNAKELYLTFDNGYENGYTANVLDVLKKKKVPAAFFVTGHYLKEEPELVNRMVKEGHIVGNHSFSHPNLAKESDADIREELESVETLFTKITGKRMPKYLRPPRGVFSERTLAVSNQLGYTNVFWSLAFKDWETNNQKGWKYAYDNIMNRVHPGAIMLLHTVSKDNAEALEKVIDDLKKDGYTFHSLDELMAKETVPKWLITP